MYVLQTVHILFRSSVNSRLVARAERQALAALVHRGLAVDFRATAVGGLCFACYSVIIDEIRHS